MPASASSCVYAVSDTADRARQAWVFVYLTVPETSGRTIEECRQLFERGDVGGSARQARAESPGYSAVAETDAADTASRM